MLDLLGLDSVAETVYREMLAHPDEGVVELAVRLNLPESQFRKALDCLTELTLVRTSLEDPSQIRAVSPQLGMEILLTHQQAELAAQQHRLEAGRAAAVKLISEYAYQESAVHESTTAHLRGVDAVRDYLAVLNARVKKEFLTLAPGGPQTPANMQASRPLNQRLLERGIRMRTVYLDSIRRDAATMAHAEWITRQGGQVRTVAVLPTRLIICDRKVAIIAADSDDTSVGAIAVTAPGMLAALCALFESIWQRAEPLGELPRVEGGELTQQQCEALRLLAQGCTDESIAKRLGVSNRTARRVTTGLLARLDARSRFQAGVHAVQRGYLPAVSE